MISKLKSIIFPVSAPQVLASKLYAGCFRILHPDAAGGNADFEITVGKSKVPNAGYGLHVTKGVVKKGDIVALYSGKC